MVARQCSDRYGAAQAGGCHRVAKRGLAASNIAIEADHRAKRVQSQDVVELIRRQLPPGLGEWTEPPCSAGSNGSDGNSHRVERAFDDDHLAAAPCGRGRQRLIEVDGLVEGGGTGRVLVLRPTIVANVAADEAARRPSTNPIHQPHPPTPSTNPIHQPHPPTPSTNPIHQPHPPTPSTNPIHQPHPPTPSTNPSTSPPPQSTNANPEPRQP